MLLALLCPRWNWRPDPQRLGFARPFCLLTARTTPTLSPQEVAYARAKRVAQAANLPLMTHHALSSVDLHGCPGALSAGDIYTHTYHGWASTITPSSQDGGKDLQVHAACLAAREVMEERGKRERKRGNDRDRRCAMCVRREDACAERTFFVGRKENCSQAHSVPTSLFHFGREA